MTATSLNAAVVLPEVQALLATTLAAGDVPVDAVAALPVHRTVTMLLWRERRDLRTGTVCRELSDEGKTLALALGALRETLTPAPWRPTVTQPVADTYAVAA